MAQTARSRSKLDRMDTRLRSDQKRLFEQAADLQGTTLTDFVLVHLQAAATATIKEAQTLRLRGEDREVFIDALLNPPKANEFAKAAAVRYRKQVSF